MRSIKDYSLLALKGLAMGAADVIPGVSGGTIAFITGIYDELLKSIKSIDLDAIKLLTKFQIKAFWQHINGSFLITLLSGIAISVLSLAKLMNFLLLNHPIMVWSFFFGLIIISALIVARDIKEKSWKAVLSGILGIIIAYAISELTPSQTPENWWFIVIAGSVAICAMILPGISGAFILLILGKYKFIVTALDERNIPIIALFMAGCIIGILLFSRVISWLLDHYKSLTIAMLAGFMIGSLNKVWPWKIIDSYRLNSHGEQVPYLDHNVLPHQYLQETTNNPHIVEAILLASFGILIVVLIEKIANKFNAKSA
ncbi:MAG: putative membrane protein [Marivirga sp.]|jgi:putative membrane protein